MAEIDAKLVMRLRNKTGAPMMECKAALQESGGDLERAVEVLRKRGLKSASGKGDREVSEGLIFSYVHHNGKLAVLAEVACETDFVARNQEFRQFGADLCLHIASMAPRFLSRDQIPADVVDKEREIAIEQTRQQMAGKPDQVIQKAVDGRIQRFFAESCLVDQPFVKDESLTVDQVTKQLIAKTGENIRIRRFVRLELGG
jgi:elongation factor Ts